MMELQIEHLIGLAVGLGASGFGGAVWRCVVKELERRRRTRAELDMLRGRVQRLESPDEPAAP